MNCQCKDAEEIDGWEAEDYASNHLRKARVGNWEIEYKCPDTGFHWLMDYPHGELQGGGPPRLRRLPTLATSK
jgi:hypothetical protein